MTKLTQKELEKLTPTGMNLLGWIWYALVCVLSVGALVLAVKWVTGLVF